MGYGVEEARKVTEQSLTERSVQSICLHDQTFRPQTVRDLQVVREGYRSSCYLTSDSLFRQVG